MSGGRVSTRRRSAEILETALLNEFGIGRLFWRIREAVIVGDAASGRIVLWNPGAETLFGYTAEEAVDMPIERLVPEPLIARHRAGIASYAETGRGKVTESGRVLDVTAIRKDGREVPVELSLTSLDDQPAQRTLVMAIVRDASERRMAAEEAVRSLREQAARLEAEAAQRRFALLAEASALLAGSLDYELAMGGVARLAVPLLGDWCCAYLSAGGAGSGDGNEKLRPAALAHVDPDYEALLAELRERYPIGGRSPHPVARALRLGRSEFHPGPGSPTFVAATGDPDERSLLNKLGLTSYLCVPLVARGRALGAIELGTAARERRYTAQELALAEDFAGRIALAIDNARLYREAQDAIQVRDEFLASASHELRTPVTTIKAFAQLLEKRVRDRRQGPDELIEGLESIDETATRLAGQIRQLLDLSRLQSGRGMELNRRPTDLVSLARDVAAIQERLSGRHQISVESAQPELFGMWDGARIERALLNLVSNAVRYSGGGEIAIRIARATGARGDQAVVRISDQGIGIPADDLPRVFERFYRARNVAGRLPGTGVGLTSVRDILEQHGGTIAVESVEGVGTTFTLQLPCAAPQEAVIAD